MSVSPSALEPPAAPLEAVDEELDPQAANTIPIITMTRRILIKVIIRLFIFFINLPPKLDAFDSTSNNRRAIIWAVLHPMILSYSGNFSL
jgi:hypothetical protein